MSREAAPKVPVIAVDEKIKELLQLKHQDEQGTIRINDHLSRRLSHLDSDIKGVKDSQLNHHKKLKVDSNGRSSFPQKWVTEICQIYRLQQNEFTDLSLADFKACLNNRSSNARHDGSTPPPKKKRSHVALRLEQCPEGARWLAQQLEISENDQEEYLSQTEEKLLGLPFDELRHLYQLTGESLRTNDLNESGAKLVRDLIHWRLPRGTAPHPLKVDIQGIKGGNPDFQAAFHQSLVEVVMAARDNRPTCFRPPKDDRDCPPGQGLIARVAEVGRDESGRQEATDVASEAMLTLECWQEKAADNVSENVNGESLATCLRQHLEKHYGHDHMPQGIDILSYINLALKQSARCQSRSLRLNDENDESVQFTYYVLDERMPEEQPEILQKMKETLSSITFVNIGRAKQTTDPEILEFEIALRNILLNDLQPPG